MIYGYIRVSSQKQTVEHQEYEIKEYAAKNSIKIDTWVEETISSRKALKHRKLGQLLDDLQENDIIINSLEFFINSFNFCRGKRGVFLCTATGGRRGWQRKATGCQGLWRRVSGTAGSCGEPCADGPGLREAVCGRAAGASVRTGRGVCADGPGR